MRKEEVSTFKSRRRSSTAGSDLTFVPSQLAYEDVLRGSA